MTLQGSVAFHGNKAHWTETALRAFLRRTEHFGEIDLPLLGVGLHEGVRQRDDNDGRPAASEDLSGYKIVRKGDVIMNRLGKPHGSVGVSPVHGITSPAYWVMEIDRSLAYPPFVHHLLRSKHLVREYERLGKYMPPNQFDISWDAFRSIEVPLPRLDEQQRIADFLDAETARIDGLQCARDRQLAALDELVASRISALVPARTNAPFVRLGYLAVIQSGITVDGKRDSGPDAVTLPYLRVANVQDGHLNLEAITEITAPREIARSSILKRGDVLMTEGGDLDKLGRGTVWNAEIESCLHQNHVFAVRPDQRKLMPEYLSLITRTAYARAYFESTGTKTTNLASTSSSKIRDFRIPLIGLTDQARVVHETASWLENIADVQAVLTLQRALLAERRQALITAAVTGEITV